MLNQEELEKEITILIAKSAEHDKDVRGLVQNLMALFTQQNQATEPYYKSKIVSIGTFDEDGKPTNWIFNSENHPDSAMLRILPNREILWDGWSIRELHLIADAAQATIFDAYQRGRIDEMKTCEEAKRHDYSKAIVAELDYLLEHGSGGGNWRRIIEQRKDFHVK